MYGPVVILGLGFTTQRLALRLQRRGVSVYAIVRNSERFAEFARRGIRLCAFNSGEIPKDAVLIHSVPPLSETETAAIHAIIVRIAPRRILYISSTGVYGSQAEVNESTPAAPHDKKGRDRVAEEEWLRTTCASTLVLRSAAIYGPNRGIHVRLREGKLPRGAGGMVSRIHVDDLAAILETGIDSQLSGVWPVADDHPASSEEVAAWCANLLGLAELLAVSAQSFPVAGRRVDGSEIRRLLGVELNYPSYRTGIPASLEEEARESNQ